MELSASLNELSGVGPRIAACLQRLGLHTVQDLLFHLPIRYQDRTRITPISALREGDQVLIEGEIQGTTLSPGRRPSLLCQLSDGSGRMQLRFFHFTAQQKNQLSTLGIRLRCFGEVRRAYRQLVLEMIHPEYRQMQATHELPLATHLTPVYPTTAGLSQPLLRRLIDQVFQCLEPTALDLELLPPSLLEQFQWTDLVSALWFVHSPPPDADVDLLLQGMHPAQKRLVFEELIAHQLSLQISRQQIKQQAALPLRENSELQKKLLAGLGFCLTGAQQRVIEEINHDLTLPHPMLRLLQGDVGSGKTVVAAVALLRAAAQGAQAVLMAPTELLAEQHFQSISRWFTPLGIQTGHLTGRQPMAERRSILAKIAKNELSVVIGTHALLQQPVQFSRLGLIIVDEQHRFGVEQRLTLRDKGSVVGIQPHQLIMTATPIPRSLAMTAYADLDISVIDELPPGRKPVVTALISNRRRDQVIARVQHACREGRQVYWVCTLIADSEVLQCQAAEDTLQELRHRLPELKIGLVHSRITSGEKAVQMSAFAQGELDLLVATTVIEVGVDVPNASLMIIENPERLGLAQLHQLRGRVGRGIAESFCLLLYQEPLSTAARQRLQILRSTNDGFVIARADLALRGPGELLGTRQSGLPRLRIADLMRDQHLLPNVQAAGQILREQFPQQAEALVTRWITTADRYRQI